MMWGRGAGFGALWKQEFVFRHAKSEVPIRYPNGDDGWTYKSGNVRTEIQT